MEANFDKGMMAVAFIAAAFAGFVLGHGSGTSYADDILMVKDKIIKTQYDIIKQQQTEILRQEELLRGHVKY